MDPPAPGGGSGPLGARDESLAARLGHMAGGGDLRAHPADQVADYGDCRGANWTLSRRPVAREDQRAREATRKREARRRRASESINQLQREGPVKDTAAVASREQPDSLRDWRDRVGAPEVEARHRVASSRRRGLLGQERSGSVTSDYFSSQNSPIVQQKKSSQVQLQTQTLTRRPSTQIYANPLCDAEQPAVATMISSPPSCESGAGKLGGRLPVAEFRLRSHEPSSQQHYQRPQPQALADEWQSGPWRRPNPRTAANQMRPNRSNQSQQQQPDGHYYCTTSGARPSGGQQLNSLASSQQTNETCDESPSNHTTDESNQRLYNYPPDSSDYHYYQVVVPPPEVPPPPSFQPASPYRSIQRFVGNLFANQQPQATQSSQPATQTLVSNEPLIRPTSWQHRTLIDLRRQPISGNPNGAYCPQQQDTRYLESSLVPDRKLHLAHEVHHPQTQPQQQQQPAELYANEQLRRSLQFLSEKLAERPNVMSQVAAYSDLNPRYPTSTDSSLVDSPVGRTPPRSRRRRRQRGAGSPSNWPRRLLLALGGLLLILLTLAGLTLLARRQPQDAASGSHQPAQVGSVDWPTDATGQLMGDHRRRLPGELLGQQMDSPPKTLAELPASSRPAVSNVIEDATSRPPNATTTTTSRPREANSTQRPKFRPDFPPVHLARDYWTERQQLGDSEAASCPLGCGSHGLCDSAGTCSCFTGFSSPTCSIDDCPNECSHQGECRPKGQPTSSASFGMPIAADSLGFTSLSASLARNSHCPGKANPLRQLAANTHDHRLRWQCECRAEFTGPDCSQARELQCNDKLDDDLDGLIDCEDDDCCSHPVCLENLMCFKSADPGRALEAAESSQRAANWLPLASDSADSARERTAQRLQHEWRFMVVGEEAVQSYAKELAFDWGRVAILRGRVVKGATHQSAGEISGAGIVSVRISVVENPLAGFTLTRADGHFDLLVNGNEWLTLQFHRNGYAPIKRRVFVRRHRIQLLESDVELWLASLNWQPAESGRANTELPFNLELRIELARAAAYLSRADGRARHAALMECLQSHAPSQDQPPLSPPQLAPELVGSSLNDPRELRTFALVSSPSAAHETQLDVALKWPLDVSYNSASFPPAASAVKPTIVVRLIPRNWQPEVDRELTNVHLQLDVEGQMRRERLAPIAGLSYTFAWNRRNVYSQKTYGFAELNLRVGYEYRQPGQPNATSWFLGCLASAADSSEQPNGATIERLRLLDASGHLSRRIVWFRRTVHLEAHQLNQQADIGKWSLGSAHRLDSSRSVLYLGNGRSLPLALAYPPVVSPPIQLATTTAAAAATTASSKSQPRVRSAEMELQPSGRLMARGPNSSLFIILGSQLASSSRLSSARLLQVDSTGRRRLLDVPLAILTSKFSQPQAQQPDQLAPSPAAADDLELIYNNYLATLYLSSRAAGKLVQISLSSLLVLNRTLSGANPTAAAEDEIDIEPLSGFGRLTLGSSSSAADSSIPTRALRLEAPHSLALDEQRQILYLVDGHAHLVALDLSGGQATLLRLPRKMRVCRQVVDYELSGPIRGLSWNEADSSLYLLEENSILALRADLSLELLVTGAANPQSQKPSHPATQCVSQRNLGLIRSINADQPNGDLLVAHQLGKWPATTRLQLAKLKPAASQQAATLVDLHAAATWDSMIASLIDTKRADERRSQIDWRQLATSVQLNQQQPRASDQKSIPFIHLSGGFERAHSVEINSDGSIFVLDSADDSIRLIGAYSPQDFNLNRRDDVNINRLFATDAQVAGARDRKLEVLSLRQPLSAELMEFHAQSGLHLSSTLADGRQLELHYRLLWNSAGNRRPAKAQLSIDEDDRRDLEAQRLAAEYLTSSGADQMDQTEVEQLQSGAYVRLARLSDKSHRLGATRELVRLFTGERYALRTILDNQRPLAELSSDSRGLLTSYQRTSGELTLELLYDNSTRLLRETIMIQSDGRPANFAAVTTSKGTRRVAYDQLFGHYCDLQTTETSSSTTTTNGDVGDDPLIASDSNHPD